MIVSPNGSCSAAFTNTPLVAYTNLWAEFVSSPGCTYVHHRTRVSESGDFRIPAGRSLVDVWNLVRLMGLGIGNTPVQVVCIHQPQDLEHDVPRAPGHRVDLTAGTEHEDQVADLPEWAALAKGLNRGRQGRTGLPGGSACVWALLDTPALITLRHGNQESRKSETGALGATRPDEGRDVLLRVRACQCQDAGLERVAEEPGDLPAAGVDTVGHGHVWLVIRPALNARYVRGALMCARCEGLSEDRTGAMTDASPWAGLPHAALTTN